MKILQFLDKLFDLTTKVESTIQEVSTRTRLTAKKIVDDMLRSMFNMFIFALSLLLILAGAIVWLSSRLPLDLVLVCFGVLGFLYLAAQRVSIRLK